MYLLIVCVCSALSTVTLAAEDDNYEDGVKKGNEYIDEILEDMFKDRVDEYDPYVLEDSFVGFNKKVMFVNVSGEAKLHDGYIKGLSTLHRASHCSLHDDGNKLNVKADLGAGVLDFHYSGSVKFMNFGPTITVQGHLAYIEVHIEFSVDSKTGKQGKVTKFVIDDMRGMKVWVTGLGPLNWAVNPIISGVTKIFKRFVRNFMENKVEKHISQHISHFQFPVEGSGNTETPVTVTTENTEGTTQPETISPETESTEKTTKPETVPPETEAPQESPEPETIPPETEAPQESPEPETVPPETEEPEGNPESETVPPETEARDVNSPESGVILLGTDASEERNIPRIVVDSDSEESDSDESV